MSTPRAEPEVRYTPEQQRAIETRKYSVALSAGAGCGKTFVLTERFLSYFEPGASRTLAPDELSELVAITFTERAAREMRDRIRKKCSARLRAAEGADAEHWAALLRALDSARISTIHSFCAALLRSRAVEAGLDPQFQVLEQSQADALLSEVIDDELRRLVAAQDPHALDLAVRFDLDTLHSMLRTLVLEGNAAQFAHWLAVAPRDQMACWEDFHAGTVLPAVARRLADSLPSRQLLNALREHIPANPTMQQRRDVLLDRLPSAQNIAATPEPMVAVLEEILAHARVQGGGGAKVWSTAEVFETIKNAATELREMINKELLPIVNFDPRRRRSRGHRPAPAGDRR